jgi:beta-galactosidase
MGSLLFARRILLSCLALAGLAAVRAGCCDDARVSIPLTTGWRFLQDDQLTGAEQPGFADDGWAQVSVPHTWNRVGAYSAGDLFPDRVLNSKRGIGWYRLHFNVPSGFAKRRVWVQFDAASLRAEVWLNGVRLGEHLGGFSRFRFDATDALKLNQTNTLVVRTDSSLAAPGSATADILPIAGDFFIYGGLYRPVSIVATAPLHFDMLDHGAPGVYIRTERIAGGAADLSIRSKLRNDQSAAVRAQLVVTVRDAAGHAVARSIRAVSLAADGGLEVSQNAHLTTARLWQGVTDPYLYQVVAELRTPAGGLLDRVAQDFGIRQLRFDPQRGLSLNGQPLRLRGVALHQDREDKGWAVSEADERADLALITEMGANSIRLTHYQHSDTLSQWADRHGLLDWAEIPLVTRWTLADDPDPSPGLVDNARQQLVELIRQGFNHASIAVWGIANEVDFGTTLPVMYGGRAVPARDPLPLLKTLRQLAQQEDATRPTTIANCCYGRPGSPSVIDAADLSGANRYRGWYHTVAADLTSDLDAIRNDYPQVPLAVSEYGAGGAVTQYTDNPLGGPVDSRGHLQPEDYQSLVHEQSWPILAATPYLWGTWLFAMFDFSTPLRAEGDATDINTKGLVTFDHTIRKDAFYFYQANWSSAPTLHIASARHNVRVYPTTELKVYSNAESTEARLNGRNLGRRTGCPDQICRWPGIGLAPGRNVVEAIGTWPSGSRRDAVVWQLTTPAGTYRIDCGAIEGAAGPEGRYGSDDYFEGGVAAAIDAPAAGTAIGAATPTAIVNSYRQGRFTYRLPLPDGSYRVQLWFIEPQALPGARRFSVLANGAPMITDLDVAAAAGGPLRPIQRSFTVRVDQGALVLDFRGTQGDAIVSAIDVDRIEAGE